MPQQHEAQAVRTMEPCSGNCEYGDRLYGVDPRAYDGSKCGCVQCPNFEYCAVWVPPAFMSSGRCFNCDANFRKELVFRDGQEPCPICLGNADRVVEHPAECGHAICIDCFRLQWDPPVLSDLPPERYGFTSSCGVEWWECYHQESTCVCVAEMAIWRRDNPADARRWRMDNTAQHDAYDRTIMERVDPGICPLCRADIATAPTNSWT